MYSPVFTYCTGAFCLGRFFIYIKIFLIEQDYSDHLFFPVNFGCQDTGSFNLGYFICGNIYYIIHILHTYIYTYINKCIYILEFFQFPFNVYGVCPFNISDMSDLCPFFILLHSLARSLSILLIFLRNIFLFHLFFSIDFLFSISLFLFHLPFLFF